MSRPWKRGLFAAFALLVILFVTLLPVRGINRLWQDGLVRLTPPAHPSGKVVIVAIDDEIIGKIGPWPWERGQTAKLFLAIGSLHPKVLAFDGYFPHRQIPDPGDLFLGQALRDIGAAGTKIILPFKMLNVSNIPDALVPDVQVPVPLRISAYPLLYNKPAAELAPLFHSSAVEFGDTIYQRFSVPSGFINSPADLVDGICRKVPHVIRLGSEYMPSFAVAAVAAYGDAGLSSVSFEPGRVQILRTSVPLDDEGRSPLRFMGESPALPTIKAGDLLADPARFADQIQGRIVIVGVTSAAAMNRESGDFFRTVLSDRYPGAELWGIAIDNILTGDVPTSSHAMRLWELFLAIGLGLGGWYLLARFGWIGRVQAAFAIAAVAVLLAQFLIDRFFAVQSALDLPLLGLGFGFAGRWVFVESKSPATTYGDDDAKTFIRKNSGESMTKPDMPVTMTGRPVASATEETPEHFGKYKVVGELGRGAMGVVYKGQDDVLPRHVAIKVISSVRRMGEKQNENLNRFQREARAIATLNHPGIVIIYEAGEWENNSFIAMEFLDGPSLDGLLRKHRLPWRAVRAWGLQLMEALAYAHSKGVIHRDVKPANVMVVEEGRRVKLTDFGLALQQDSTLTVEGQILGTPYYMAPELIDGKRGDAASDQFALGVVLYEMLSRRRPFEGDNVRQIMLQILMHPAPPLARLTNLEVPAEAIACIDRMMAKKPEERFASLAEAAEAWRQMPG